MEVRGREVYPLDSCPPDASKDDVSYEYVIVGGGIYGTGTAWELARRGEDVLLLEKDETATGASGGPGKRGVRANGRDPRELPLMERAYEIWPSLSETIGAPTGFERTGHLRLLETQQSALQGGEAAARARAWTQRQAGIPTELVDVDELQAMEPEVSDEVTGAIYCPNDGVADQSKTTRGLASAAVREGAEIREGTAVAGLQRTGDRVTGVTTDADETIGVKDTLVVLSNTHVPELVSAEFGVTLPVWPIVPQVLITEPLDTPLLSHLIGHDFRTLAMKEVHENRVMISGGWRGRWDPDTDRGETISAHVEGNFRDAVETFPALEGVAIERADASRRDTATVDHVPIIDRLPGADNMIVGTGWTGHGFAISVAVTRLLAKWSIHGKKPEVLSPFSYARFDGA